MEHFFEKLSSYNLFNYLLPGILFVVLADKFTSYSFIQENFLLGLFLYYFIGLVISRIGSITVEPMLKWVHFIKFADYSEFVQASKKDVKIEILSEQNNMMRTFCSVFFILILLRAYSSLKLTFNFIPQNETYTLLIMLLLVFLFSYRKQTSYITKRIKQNL